MACIKISDSANAGRCKSAPTSTTCLTIRCSRDSNYGGGGGPFAFLGDFNIGVDQKTGKLLPITDVSPNPDFGRLINSFSQEGIDSRRAVRLRLRITW